MDQGRTEAVVAHRQQRSGHGQRKEPDNADTEGHGAQVESKVVQQDWRLSQCPEEHQGPDDMKQRK